ncbi:PREDICTED: protein PXR1-like [Cyphomyrmex costatus]|uniref:protein PXR1-like n=1 Tax=Cyphomyrmex costatus TaxID=456900 RepID=UPI0008522BD2|nr:PREDICTED: protein PXR1-like [Cyphomyrmex costatus]
MEESANEVVEEKIHSISLPSTECVAKEIGDGQKDILKSPIDINDTSITQTDKIDNIQRQKTKPTVLFIPSVFKETLFWPSTLQEVNSKETNNIHMRKKKNPAVVSSLKWKEYYKDKENKKQEPLLQKEERKRKREEKAREASEVKRKKQEAKEEKQRIAKEAEKAKNTKFRKVSKKTQKDCMQKYNKK